ncbi:receptor-like protein 12 [Cryptomeria japonica]|uniref:receptor-like protein 12 n=1 Tax=Cryptomeria japonica TaxID=3369 RepID=UPI0027D9FAE2|nr:receptor-like protein 12 [Cryptomeria japonica]
MAMMIIMWVLLLFAVMMSCSSACYTDERNYLLDFKEGLNFTFSYNTLQSWKGYNCCAWEGVACHPITAHVISLDLSPSSLNASWITDEYSSWPFMSWKEIRGGLFHLHHLEHLDLSGNAFFPPLAIPLQLHKLSKLSPGFKCKSVWMLRSSTNIPKDLGLNKSPC